MSRYVSVPLVATRAELLEALAALDVPVDAGPGGRQLMLEGSLECAGEPVDLRISEGSLGSVEDYGFRIEGEQTVLVCGDVDRGRLERELLAPLTTHLTRRRLEIHAAENDMDLHEVVEADGTRRLVLRRR